MCSRGENQKKYVALGFRVRAIRTAYTVTVVLQAVWNCDVRSSLTLNIRPEILVLELK